MKEARTAPGQDELKIQGNWRNFKSDGLAVHPDQCELAEQRNKAARLLWSLTTGKTAEPLSPILAENGRDYCGSRNSTTTTPRFTLTEEIPMGSNGAQPEGLGPSHHCYCQKAACASYRFMARWDRGRSTRRLKGMTADNLRRNIAANLEQQPKVGLPPPWVCAAAMLNLDYIFLILTGNPDMSKFLPARAADPIPPRQETCPL